MKTEGTVYVVDDDPAVLDSTRCLLEYAGFNAEGYTSASEYLDAYDPRKPGCLVLDLRMPEMTGLELQEKLVAIGERIPIIFVTGHGDVPACARALKAGAFDFVEKPVEGELLLELVRRAMERAFEMRDQILQDATIAQRIEQLTRRERQVMEFLYEGESMKSMALKLGITYQSVAKHRASLLEKMGVESDAQLVRLLTTHRRQAP